MRVTAKFALLISVYGGLLYWVYQLQNTDLLLLFLTLSLMIPIIYLINDRFKQQQHIAKLHQESLQAELNLLKSQINPHFFFNTLNNLYGLASERSERTQEVIYKLSQMMRFTIYDGRKNTVPVQDEIAYLENFIELNQIRYQHQLDIQFNKSIENPQQKIPPLLFINLLENAFKHGVDTQTHDQFIHFTLSTNRKAISFDIANNFDAKVLAKNKSKRGAGGLGVENLIRRLALLFPNKHTYTSQTSDGIHHASVTIDLT